MLSAGVGRSDITPPIGIAHAGWGAAIHERAEGIHMPFHSTTLYVTNGELELAILAGQQVLSLVDELSSPWDEDADQAILPGLLDPAY